MTTQQFIIESNNLSHTDTKYVLTMLERVVKEMEKHGLEFQPLEGTPSKAMVINI